MICKDFTNCLHSSLLVTNDAWIGGRRNYTWQNFVWVSGEVFGYTNWPEYSHEGDKSGCVYYKRNFIEGLKWHVGDCNERKAVVCELN